jgi:glycine cleavage system H protein
MNVPDELRYSSDHEWVRIEDGKARIGITDYAQDALGDVVFVQVPDVGQAADAGATVGEVESTKSVSEIYAPLAGTVVEVNPELEANPELVNSDPYGAGWIAVVELADPGALESLMDANAYRELTEG